MRIKMQHGNFAAWMPLFGWSFRGCDVSITAV